MRLKLRRATTFLLCLLGLGTLASLLRWLLACQDSRPFRSLSVTVLDRQKKEHRYSQNTPLVFVGGVPRSGTTLMRAMLDAHPDIRCGEETRVIPRLLSLRHAFERDGEEGVDLETLDSAVTAFLLEVIARHGEPAPLLCNKDPFTLRSAVYLSKLFPNSKFLLMLRDGRAAAHSMISRKVTIAGFDLTSYRDCLSKWSKAIEGMLTQCMIVGPERCLAVRYEDLVLQPRSTLQGILHFLDMKWHGGVLHHEDYIGRPGGVSLSRVERSTDQVIKPVNLEALTRWVGQIPADVLAEMDIIAPMLKRLGYDPNANPPDYGQPDPEVVNNTKRVLKGNFKTPLYLKEELQGLINGSNTQT
ncbi:LOW QUALITY PROTEIN: protein-tyrosine sulfotransferase 2 [Denticeps clupeoides]|uniref:LOW QUALITY PROTEIN: protein-tyrosine sulfotransferase 2 n=1 Tax=Denticeps clupeoides TaxID=299321 RepID=UPI0010A5131A|nr:LOW QUALITY PROTEIN: protein-tyrosine sulfotransferase 2-like [Denticeps clupeoides]